MDVIVEHRLDMLYSDGETREVRLRVGRPRPHPDGRGDWGCEVQAEGLRAWKGPTEVFGEGSLQALMLGTNLLRRMLSAEVARGAVARWQGEDDEGGGILDVDVLFGLPKLG
jgi:hypothetical protein